MNMKEAYYERYMEFFQDEILGMKWLNRLIGSALDSLGIDISGRIGGSIHFFIYVENQVHEFIRNANAIEIP